MKVSKCRNFGDLILKIVALVKVLKTKKTTENISKFYVGPACDALPASIPYKLLNILFWNFGLFFVFKNLTNATVFNIKFPNFRHLLSI